MIETTRRALSDYSRFVRGARLVVPALGLALAVAVVFGSVYHKADEGHFASTLVDAMNLQNGLQRMENPRYFGQTEAREPFGVSAVAAEETTRGSGLLRLEQPKADIQRQDGSWLSANAGVGLYNQTVGTLDLSGDVDVYHDGGFELHTKTATFDTRSGLSKGATPVTGNGPLGQLSGAGFMIVQSNGQVRVTGPAHMVIDQQNLPPPLLASPVPAAASPAAAAPDSPSTPLPFPTPKPR